MSADVLARRRRREHTRRRRAGVAALLLGAVVVVITFSGGVPFLRDRGLVEVQARFTDASNVRSGQPVRVKGIDVGKVTEVRGEPGGRIAVVTMALEPADRDALRADARAIVWWRTLLGRNMYVELDPGTAPGPLGDRPISERRTMHQVELDQLLDAFSAQARRGVGQSLRGVADAFADPEAVGRAARPLAPALRAVQRGLPGLRGERPGDLGETIAQTRRVAAQLSRSERDLAGLVDGAGTTLGVTAARAADLSRTLRLAPGSLGTARRELARLDGLLDVLDPLVADVRPHARDVRPAVVDLRGALRATTPLLDRARPLVRDLVPALRNLRASTRAGLPLVQDLQPVAERLRDRTIPYLEKPEADTKRPLYTLIGPLASEIADSTSIFDGQGHAISFEGGVSGRALSGILPCTVLLTDPKEQLTCENLNVLAAQLLGQKPPVPNGDDNPSEQQGGGG
ncbi:MlaD family protein [Conexibacter sp. SYSU D00693]|uniref:MlaD family protein n=1 Tax=Conexibacter sp. SYSU D00693 TaxID=2812560 RepID=UPI00196A71B8|nr:MlaD family protein [Conexibacter sp. SYSU D00693]